MHYLINVQSLLFFCRMPFQLKIRVTLARHVYKPFYRQTFLSNYTFSMKLKCPRLHVTQPESAFAQGNARWTNLDLDPVPPHQRKWGVLSFVGMLPIHPPLIDLPNSG